MDDLVKRINHFNGSFKDDTMKLMHYVGIPLVILGVLSFLSFMSINLFGIIDIHFGWIASLLVVAYLCMIDLEIGLGALAVLFVMNILAAIIAPASGFGFFMSLVFIGGGLGAMWYGAQQAGTALDPKKTACLMIDGPIAMVAELLFMVGMKPDLKKALGGEDKKEEKK